MKHPFFIKSAALLLTVSAVIGLAGCRQNIKESSPSSSVAASGSEAAVKETAASKKTETASQTSAAVTVAPTTAAAAAKTSTEIQWPLRGGASTEEQNQRRVLAVMIDNHPDARMQAGFTQADMVFEMKVEGTYTRYMMLFQSQDPPLVGPIRSARPYFIERMEEFKPIYAHVGGSVEALQMLTDPRYDEVEGITVSSDTIWRYNDTGKEAPHNAYASGESLRNYAAACGYADQQKITGYRFHETPEVPKGDAASEVVVDFAGDNQSAFSYDQETGCYTFTKDGELQVDENNGERVQVQNIVIQETEYQPLPRDGSLWTCRQVGTGSGYYVSRGVRVPITWSKASADDETKYYTADGQELVLNPGLTWVEVTDTDTGISFR